MVQIDALGLSCPEPLILAQQAMKANPGDAVEVLVSTAAPRDNISRYAARQNRAVTVEQIPEGFKLTIAAKA